jgi:hypothetical protein
MAPSAKTLLDPFINLAGPLNTPLTTPPTTPGSSPDDIMISDLTVATFMFNTLTLEEKVDRLPCTSIAKLG